MQTTHGRRFFFLIGPSGIGKDYGVGSILAEYHGVTRFVTGDWCRENAQKFSDNGHLAPDDIIFDAVKSDFESQDAHDYLIDAPRSVGQVDRFMRMYSECDPDAAVYTIHIDGDRSVCEGRLSERAIRQGRLDDAKPEVIEARLDNWYRVDGIRDNVVPYVQERTKYIRINGNFNMELIRAHVINEVCPRIFSAKRHGQRVAR